MVYGYCGEEGIMRKGRRVASPSQLNPRILLMPRLLGTLEPDFPPSSKVVEVMMYMRQRNESAEALAMLPSATTVPPD